MEDEKQEKLKRLIKEKVNHEVRLVLHGELRRKDLGNMYPPAKPRTTDEEHLITFLGIYGIGGHPLYIYGTCLEDGKNRLYRNSLDITVDEDRGIPNSESHITLQKLDDINIHDWFYFGFSDESELKKRLRVSEPSEKYLAERILKGTLYYFPGTYSPSFSIIDEAKFIDQVLKYFDRIV